MIRVGLVGSCMQRMDQSWTWVIQVHLAPVQVSDLSRAERTLLKEHPALNYENPTSFKSRAEAATDLEQRGRGEAETLISLTFARYKVPVSRIRT